MDVDELIEALGRPAVYPFDVESVEVRQTHISVVFLAGRWAYKVKKPVDLGFLDFTTLERRHHFCHEEVRLNRRLAPDVYRGVVPIVEVNGRLRISDDPDLSPADSRAVEYAVKMRRLPEEATLLARLEREELAGADVERIALRIADFHRDAERSDEIARYGRWSVVAENAMDNFRVSREQVGDVVPSSVFRRLERRTEEELERLRDLVEARAERGVPCDTHGDLHLQHVYVFPGREPPDDLVVVDCVEFNDRFRYADPVADAAFLSMDLRFRGRRDLADRFADAYFDRAGDEEGRSLLALYEAYRSAVRAKVEGFRALEQEVPPEQRAEARTAARAYWTVGLGALSPPSRRPCLVLVGGLPGTGKSTLSRALGDRAGFDVLSSDRVRKELAGLSADADAGEAFGRGIYSSEWTERTYRELLDRAVRELREGGRVVVDASFREEERRRQFLDGARRNGVPFLFLLCRASGEVAGRRLDERSSDASDADRSVLREMTARWEPPSAAVERWTRPVDTEAPVSETVDAALAILARERMWSPGAGPG
jgi:aminoglycoside phosphotransferase family enzyme/predicted kinase